MVIYIVTGLLSLIGLMIYFITGTHQWLEGRIGIILHGTCLAWSLMRLFAIRQTWLAARRNGWNLDRRDVMREGFLLRLADLKRVPIYGDFAVLPAYDAGLSALRNLVVFVRRGTRDQVGRVDHLKKRLKSPLLLAIVSLLYTVVALAVIEWLQPGAGGLQPVLFSWWWELKWMLACFATYWIPLVLISSFILSWPSLNSDMAARFIAIFWIVVLWAIIPT